MMRLGLVSLLCLPLMACASTKLTPEQTHQLFVDFRDAGCGGRVDIDVGASTGQLGGQAHGSVGLHGECPQREPAPLPKSE